MFTPAQYAALKAELITDPASLGYAAKIATQHWVGVAELLATTNATWTCKQPKIPLALLLQWYAQGPAAKLLDYANKMTNNAALRAICIAIPKIFSGVMPYFDLSDSKNQQMVAALVSGGVLAVADQTSLADLQTLSGVTRTQAVLNLPDAVATDWDVRFALGAQP